MFKISVSEALAVSYRQSPSLVSPISFLYMQVSPCPSISVTFRLYVFDVLTEGMVTVVSQWCLQFTEDCESFLFQYHAFILWLYKVSRDKKGCLSVIDFYTTLMQVLLTVTHCVASVGVSRTLWIHKISEDTRYPGRQFCHRLYVLTTVCTASSVKGAQDLHQCVARNIV